MTLRAGTSSRRRCWTWCARPSRRLPSTAGPRSLACPTCRWPGHPADDVSHILAELLDNATSKSPQSAVVVVRAERTGDGTLVLTVEDSGIGIPTDQLADINTRLGRPPVLEAATTRHIGLYVVGRLAERHGLRVQLRERPYGGIAAHVILPRELFHDRPEPTERNGRGAAAGSPIRTGAGPVHDPGTEAGHEAASPASVRGGQRGRRPSGRPGNQRPGQRRGGQRGRRPSGRPGNQRPGQRRGGRRMNSPSSPARRLPGSSITS